MSIMAVGMAIAVAWHGWQGWGLGKGYPYNTFLFKSEVRFSDLTDVTNASALPTPYLNNLAGYPPSAYVIFGCLLSVPKSTAILLVLSVTSLGFLTALTITLFPIFWDNRNPVLSFAVLVFWSLGLALGSYPLWLSLDRCNIELLLATMATMATMALLCFRWRFFLLGLVSLFPPICFKTFPILLTALFLRRGHIWKIISVGLAAVILNLCSLAFFPAPIKTSWQLWQHNLTKLNETYVIHNAGLAGSASPWNTLRALLETYVYWSTGAPSGSLVASDSQIEALYLEFSCVAFATVVAVVAYSVFLEREFYRRTILLLILMSLVVPNGADYRLLYANIALIILIALPSRRRLDLLATALLAFVVIPKKEILLTYLGPSDSGTKDISIAVLLNSPSMLAALTILIAAGWPDRAGTRFRQKFSSMFSASRITG